MNIMNFMETVRTRWLMPAVSLLIAVITMPSVANDIVRMQTDLGGIDIELFEAEAPVTVENFLNYVNDGDYEGTLLHRSISGFITQGGGYIFSPENGSLLSTEGDRTEGGGAHIAVDSPIIGEPDAINRPNVRGTIAMAKTSAPNSATSEWFFNLADNPLLDNPANVTPFTVFGRVLGDGMDVVDAIAAQPICSNMLMIPSLCGPQEGPETRFQFLPLTGMFAVDGLTLSDHVTIINQRAMPNLVRNYNLVEIRRIGRDSDGDGIIDAVENAGPNNGDANMDSTSDSAQQNVATFQTASGGQVTLESPPGTWLESTDVLGQTFALSTYGLSTTNLTALPAVVDGLEFPQGYARFAIKNVQAGGSVAVNYSIAGVTSRCQLANSFFQYGSTPDDPSPHWYEFLFDGETGAEINGDVVVLNYVDGKRGDSDLSENGVIAAAGGPSTVSDGDSILSEIEGMAENDGDGNNDGICDSAQGNVLSLPDLRGDYVTFEVDEPHTVDFVRFFVGPEIDPEIFSDASVLQGFNLQHNLVQFGVTIAGGGDSVSVKLVLPPGESPASFFKFGPTPDNAEPHWYEFLFDGETGAEIDGNVITLYFVDGKRGDSDVNGTNGVIFDPGAPVFKVQNSGSGSGGGGCSISANSTGPRQAGAWWLLLVMFGLVGAWRYRRKQ